MTVSRDSSSLTAAVIAMEAILPRLDQGGRTRLASRRSGRAGPSRPRRPTAARTSSAPSDGGDRAQDVRVGHRRVGRPARRRAEVGGVRGEHLEVLLGREAGGLPRLRGEVERDEHAGAASSRRASRRLGHQQVRQHAGEPRPGPEDDPVGGVDRLHAPPGTPAGRPARAGRRRRGPGRGRDRDLAADRARAFGLAGSMPDLRPRCPAASVAIGSTRPCAPSSRPTGSRPGDGVAEQLPQRDDQQVAHRVAVQRRRCRRSGAGRPRATAGPTRRRRTARPAPSAGRPGAGTPNSRRSRPLDPPSSATVTTAVSSVGDVPQRAAARRPGRDRRRGDHPGRAVVGRGHRRSLAPQVAVDDVDVDAVGRAAAGRTPRPWPRCGACRRCSRPRAVR